MTQGLEGPMTRTKKINTKDIKISYNDTRRTNDMYKKDKYKGQ